jgi:hypothetical protein
LAKAQAIETKQWLLLALRASRGGLTAVQLQKALFLLGERRSDAVGKGFYRFEPYNYGPFCRQVYSDADMLAGFGYIEIDESRGRALRRYRLTPAGVHAADQLAAQAPQGGLKYLADVVDWVQSLSFNQLVRAVYQAYPEMRANSVFQEPR